MATGGGARAWQLLKRSPDYGTAWRALPVRRRALRTRPSRYGGSRAAPGRRRASGTARLRGPVCRRWPGLAVLGQMLQATFRPKRRTRAVPASMVSPSITRARPATSERIVSPLRLSTRSVPSFAGTAGTSVRSMTDPLHCRRQRARGFAPSHSAPRTEPTSASRRTPRSSRETRRRRAGPTSWVHGPGPGVRLGWGSSRGP